jgi:hypothetical protein
MTYRPVANMQSEAGVPSRRAGIPNGFINNPMTPQEIMHAHATNAGIANNSGDDNMGGLLGQFTNLGVQSGGMPQASGSIPHGAAFMNTADGNLVFNGPYPGTVQPIFPEHVFGPQAVSAMAYSAPYPTGYPAHLIPFTPGRAVTYGDRIPREVPGLENRRGSYSTSATESTPATPFFGGTTERLNGGARVASERSAYTTPSPREALSSFVHGAAVAGKPAADPEIELLLTQNPPIPTAVPAVWTEHIKPLDHCLENRIQGNRNVYIRGLHPTTDDQLLASYAGRFGEIEQSKAIIDTATGACKG